MPVIVIFNVYPQAMSINFFFRTPGKGHFASLHPTYSSDMLPRSHKCWFISATTKLKINGRKLFGCEFKGHDKSLIPKIPSFYSNKIFHLEPFLAFFSFLFPLQKKSISRTTCMTVMEWWKGRYIIIFRAFGWLCSIISRKNIYMLDEMPWDFYCVGDDG